MKNGAIVLQNDDLTLTIVHPDDRDDAHLYTRYGYCGYIVQIGKKADGMQVLASPKIPFAPFSGEGFPDEFEMPVGYDEARAGEEFLKIGIGCQIKKSDSPYTNHDRHTVSRYAENTVQQEQDAVRFTQRCALRGYAYEYGKTVRLAGEKVIVSHFLRNVGQKSIDTLWYSHAFVPYGNGREISVHIASAYAPYGGEEFLSVQEGSRVLSGGKRYVLPCSAVQKGVCLQFRAECDAENTQILFADGTQIYRADGDFCARDLQVFVNDRIVSAEPKLPIRLPAGGEKNWSTEYTF